MTACVIATRIQVYFCYLGRLGDLQGLAWPTPCLTPHGQKRRYSSEIEIKWLKYMSEISGSITAPLEDVDLVVEALDKNARPATGEVVYYLIHPRPPWPSRDYQINANRIFRPAVNRRCGLRELSRASAPGSPKITSRPYQSGDAAACLTISIDPPPLVT
jgi:hypothetical protein